MRSSLVDRLIQLTTEAQADRNIQSKYLSTSPKHRPETPGFLVSPELIAALSLEMQKIAGDPRVIAQYDFLTDESAAHDYLKNEAFKDHAVLTRDVITQALSRLESISANGEDRVLTHLCRIQMPANSRAIASRLWRTLPDVLKELDAEIALQPAVVPSVLTETKETTEHNEMFSEPESPLFASRCKALDEMNARQQVMQIHQQIFETAEQSIKTTLTNNKVSAEERQAKLKHQEVQCIETYNRVLAQKKKENELKNEIAKLKREKKLSTQQRQQLTQKEVTLGQIENVIKNCEQEIGQLKQKISVVDAEVAQWTKLLDHFDIANFNPNATFVKNYQQAKQDYEVSRIVYEAAREQYKIRDEQCEQLRAEKLKAQQAEQASKKEQQKQALLDSFSTSTQDLIQQWRASQGDFENTTHLFLNLNARIDSKLKAYTPEIFARFLKSFSDQELQYLLDHDHDRAAQAMQYLKSELIRRVQDAKLSEEKEYLALCQQKLVHAEQLQVFNKTRTKLQADINDLKALCSDPVRGPGEFEFTLKASITSAQRNLERANQDYEAEKAKYENVTQQLRVRSSAVVPVAMSPASAPASSDVLQQSVPQLAPQLPPAMVTLGIIATFIRAIKSALASIAMFFQTIFSRSVKQSLVGSSAGLFFKGVVEEVVAAAAPPQEIESAVSVPQQLKTS